MCLHPVAAKLALLSFPRHATKIYMMNVGRSLRNREVGNQQTDQSSNKKLLKQVA